MPDEKTLRELVREVHENVGEIKICVAKIETKQDMEIKRLDKTEKKIENLNLWKNINTTINGALISVATYFGVK